MLTTRKQQVCQYGKDISININKHLKTQDRQQFRQNKFVQKKEKRIALFCVKNHFEQ